MPIIYLLMPFTPPLIYLYYLRCFIMLSFIYVYLSLDAADELIFSLIVYLLPFLSLHCIDYAYLMMADADAAARH